MAPRSNTLQLHPSDDVVIARTRLPAGTVVETSVGPIELQTSIDAGHKIAIRAVAQGGPVLRYGQVIGFASKPVQVGDHVHVHNLRGGDPVQTYQVGRDVRPVALHPPEQMRFFDGYRRDDGRVGTRNYVAVISTVNCSAAVSKLVSERFRDVSRAFPNVDGVVALTHRGGCGHIANGEDHRLLERVLGGYARHPNIAAVVIVGLGCEVNQPLTLITHEGLSPQTPVVGVQAAGGTRKAVEATVAEVSKLVVRANEWRRMPQPVSNLVLGTNCGGSDGYSGITANPALGWAVDELVRYGGAALLGETTEIYGAEQLLIRRATSEAVANKLLERIAWWRRYLAPHGGDVDSNPSPGNVAGGISTVLEKSLGGVSKGGTTPMVDVLQYAERVTGPGFHFMDTPGYDPVSVTGMVAGGANVVAFTTGRGSAIGGRPVPYLKLASNSEMYRRMSDDMDVDCGVVLDGVSIEEMGRTIFEEVIAVASGKQTHSEQLGLGEEEFQPWLPGPTL